MEEFMIMKEVSDNGVRKINSTQRVKFALHIARYLFSF